MFIKICGHRINTNAIASYRMSTGGSYRRPYIEIFFIGSNEDLPDTFSFKTNEEAEEILKKLDIATGVTEE